jgi:xanthine/uracil permease
METETPEKETESNVKNRLVLPVLIPIVVALLVGLLGISFSRIFLAGAGGGEEAAAEAVEHSKSSAPVMWATIVTIIVLLGAVGISIMRMRSTSFKLIISGAVLAVILAGAVLFSAGGSWRGCS